MLVERAAANLYRSKQAGGDTITVREGATPDEQRGLEPARSRRQPRTEAPTRILTKLEPERPHEGA
jgi:hypothetical protein